MPKRRPTWRSPRSLQPKDSGRHVEKRSTRSPFVICASFGASVRTAPMKGGTTRRDGMTEHTQFKESWRQLASPKALYISGCKRGFLMLNNRPKARPGKSTSLRNRSCACENTLNSIDLLGNGKNEPRRSNKCEPSVSRFDIL